jgi:hypothetical protein
VAENAINFNPVGVLNGSSTLVTNPAQILATGTREQLYARRLQSVNHVKLGYSQSSFNNVLF